MPEGIDWLNELNLLDKNRIICLVDGEHYPPVTKWAVKSIEQKGGDVVGLVFIGGTEKIGDDLNVLFDPKEYPLFTAGENQELSVSAIIKAVREQVPDVVVDLSDMPVVDYDKRFRIASVLLNHNVIYAGADFIFRPPAQKDVLTKPAITIWGTGKRVGKTAVSVTIANILKDHGIKPAVIAMGRGGPSEPEVIDTENLTITPEYLLEIVKAGKHAASDYWEHAALSGIPAIGCRRCGGGFAGNPFITNVPEGVRIANELPVDIVIMEGSGPTLPPVKTAGKILVTGAGQPLEHITGYLDEYRLLSSDLAVVTMCEEPMAGQAKVDAILEGIKRLNPDIEIALTVFRPEPLGDIQGKNIFLATTAPESVINSVILYLEEEYDCTIAGYSTHLSDRSRLKEDLKNNISAADVLLTEIKAASIDVAAKTARECNMEIMFMHNRPALVGGTVTSLDASVLSVCSKTGIREAIR